MPLQIITPVDPITIDQLVTAIYAQPGSGRTTLGYTTDKPLVFDFDQGSHRSAFRILGDTVRPRVWADVELTPEDLEPYDTVVLDTAGRALEMLAIHLINRDPKLARPTGELTLQGYGALKAVFSRWVNTVKASGCDIVFCCHMDEQQKGDRTIERLDVMGGTRQEIYKVSDLMGKIIVGDQGVRLLDFRPGEASFGKDPVGVGRLKIPNLETLDDKRWLGSIIRDTKAKLNQMTEDQRRVQAERDDFAKMVLDADKPDDLTDLMKSANGDQVMRAIVARRVKDLGLVVDKDRKCFVLPEKPTPAVAATDPDNPPAEPADTSLPDPKSKKKKTTTRRKTKAQAQQERLEAASEGRKAEVANEPSELFS